MTTDLAHKKNIHRFELPDLVEEAESIKLEQQNKSSHKKQRRTKKQKNNSISKREQANAERTQQLCPSPQVDMKLEAVDMTEWLTVGLDLHSSLLLRLSVMGFTSPTPIQRAMLPKAMVSLKDVIAIAETGSGKTLSYGIPILDGLLRLQDTGSGKGERKRRYVCAYASLNSSCCFTYVLTLPFGLHSLPRSALRTMPSMKRRIGGVLALIMCPVRELAMQVKSHLDALSKNLGVKVVAVVGGLAEQRQERLLKCLPEIIVATPGRFWELAKSQPYLSDLSCLRYLVIDEVDRMLEPGHFRELNRILEVLTTAHTLPDSRNVTTPDVKVDKKTARQTFLVSATLPPGEEELEKKILKQCDSCSPRDRDKWRRSEGESSLSGLVRRLCLRPKPAVLNITKLKRSSSNYNPSQVGSNAGTLHSTEPTLPEGLSLAHVKSLQKDKAAWLYVFLLSHTGRTMVFLNSIKLVRYLAAVLNRLELPCGAIHSQMRQKARLKSFDRFCSQDFGVLVATDVAARGLDVPNIDHVVHYDIPSSLELFVHRSGRTARATRSGIALCIVSPQDDEKYHRVRVSDVIFYWRALKFCCS